MGILSIHKRTRGLVLLAVLATASDVKAFNVRQNVRGSKSSPVIARVSSMSYLDSLSVSSPPVVPQKEILEFEEPNGQPRPPLPPNPPPLPKGPPPTSAIAADDSLSIMPASVEASIAAKAKSYASSKNTAVIKGAPREDASAMIQENYENQKFMNTVGFAVSTTLTVGIPYALFGNADLLNNVENQIGQFVGAEGGGVREALVNNGLVRSYNTDGVTRPSQMAFDTVTKSAQTIASPENGAKLQNWAAKNTWSPVTAQQPHPRMDEAAIAGRILARKSTYQAAAAAPTAVVVDSGTTSSAVETMQEEAVVEPEEEVPPSPFLAQEETAEAPVTVDQTSGEAPTYPSTVLPELAEESQSVTWQEQPQQGEYTYSSVDGERATDNNYVQDELFGDNGNEVADYEAASFYAEGSTEVQPVSWQADTELVQDSYYYQPAREIGYEHGYAYDATLF